MLRKLSKALYYYATYVLCAELPQTTSELELIFQCQRNELNLPRRSRCGNIPQREYFQNDFCCLTITFSVILSHYPAPSLCMGCVVNVVHRHLSPRYDLFVSYRSLESWSAMKPSRRHFCIQSNPLPISFV